MLNNSNKLTEFLDKPNGQRLTQQQLREHLLAGLNSPIAGLFDDNFIESLGIKHQIRNEEKKT